MTVREAVALILAKFAGAYGLELPVGQDGVPLAARVWEEALSDLSPELILAAGDRVLREHPFPGLPAISVVREAAVQLALGAPSPSQAWAMLRDPKCHKHGPYGSAIAWERLPDVVAEAGRRFGQANILEEVPTPYDFERFKEIYLETLRDRARELGRVSLRAGPIADHGRGRDRDRGRKAYPALEGSDDTAE